jgi:catechol 2,3-dioxygenase
MNRSTDGILTTHTGSLPRPERLEQLMAEGAVAAPKLHHFSLKTCRQEEMIAWYATVAGFRVMHKFEGGAWLTNDAANHRMGLLCSPELSDDPDKLLRTGIHHTAFEFDTLGDLLDTYVRLKDEGIEPHATLDHGMTMSMYYVDPDGNSVELQADAFGDWAKSSEFLATDAFVANPIGTSFDPDAAVAARAEGASDTELHRRAYGGDFPTSQPLDLRFPSS